VPQVNGKAVCGMLKELIWSIRCIAQDRSRRLTRCTVEHFRMLGSFCATMSSARFPIGRIYSTAPIPDISRRRRTLRWSISRRTSRTTMRTLRFPMRGELSRRLSRTSADKMLSTRTLRILAMRTRPLALPTDQEGDATLNRSSKCGSSVRLKAFPFRTVDCRHWFCCPAAKLHQGEEIRNWSATSN
jgi:hypothetical protein